MSFRLSKREQKRRSGTHNSSFEIRWFPVENVHRLDTVVDHTKGPEEEPHKMTMLGKRSSWVSTAGAIHAGDVRGGTYLVTSPFSFINMVPSFCRTATRNW